MCSKGKLWLVSDLTTHSRGAYVYVSLSESLGTIQSSCLSFGRCDPGDHCLRVIADILDNFNVFWSNNRPFRWPRPIKTRSRIGDPGHSGSTRPSPSALEGIPRSVRKASARLQRQNRLTAEDTRWPDPPPTPPTQPAPDPERRKTTATDNRKTCIFPRGPPLLNSPGVSGPELRFSFHN
ncbi:unnamed protein product [Protopolystoma xenopodis]|uniref:Uncharacterized protein n=1 Tax=Protopolystoma xenopodis TaxID=117903 RepID=A0A3S5BH66_9PLAT|nr:unnamed protein product [Protopolystoma xenopodis]